MGITHVTVRVANLRKDQPSYEADFLIDTGAIDCLVPAHEDRLPMGVQLLKPC